MKPLFLVRLDLFKSRKIKGHYRKLPNGRVVWIAEHFDKRQGAKKKYPGFQHKVIHADAEKTTYVNHNGEVEEYKHYPFRELDQDGIHDHLNSALSVDDKLAFEMWKHKHSIGDFEKFLDEAVAKEKDRKDPQFTNKKDAKEFYFKSKQGRNGSGVKGIKEFHNELRKELGDVTTYANAYKNHAGYRDYVDYTAEDTDNTHQPERDLAKMIRDHSASAFKADEKEREEVERAQKLKPEDCPKIHGISKNIEAFGHQAETIAKLGILRRAIVDVDMGGGKGLILPADALNLMGQGKVKKPLVVVTGATLLQNASKIHEYTDNQVNVFMISNDTIRDDYDGDLERLTHDIQNAPPNTIFMTSYDTLAYLGPDEKDENKEFRRARAIAAAGFDHISCDESQYIKGTHTNRFKAMQFFSTVKYKRVATGTFLSNNPLDTLGQLNFLYPNKALKEAEFKQKYGYKETKEGIEWTGLKQLRRDLLDMGMISLRRSAWIDKLPKREEVLSVSKMDNKMKAVYDAVLNDILDSLEKEAEKNPSIKKIMAGDDELFDEESDLPPSVLAKLNLVGAVTDHPHELAEMMEAKMNRIKDYKNGDEDDPEMEAMIENLSALGSATRKGILSLKGTVSPKAKDVYKVLEDHFSNPKNGKYVVFCQRRMSAQHILKNMPKHLRDKAVYYDAENKKALADYLSKDKGSAQIIVAVDQSIKEGVNMQIGNGMYRYDHHFSPGNQEQSYARIWRFGQDKPTKFHIGVVDGGIDVPKYARLVTKLAQNMNVISDFEADSGAAFKLSLKNLRENNDASILDKFMDLNKSIIDFQKEENKPLAKRYAKNIKISTGENVGGKKAQLLHGNGAYHSNIDLKEIKGVTPQDADALLGHLKDALRDNGKKTHIFDPALMSNSLHDLTKLLSRHQASRGGKTIEPFVVDQYIKEHNDANEKEDHLKDAHKKIYTDVINRLLAGKKHKLHSQTDHGDALQAALEDHEVKVPKDVQKFLASDLKDAYAWVKKNSPKEFKGYYEREDKQPLYFGNKRVHNGPMDAFWKTHEKKVGEKFSDKHKKVVNTALAMVLSSENGLNGVNPDDFEGLIDFPHEEETKAGKKK
ncbi:MAG: SNF2-related protein [Pseudobdellovibrionaceae bacterium]